MSGPLCLNLLLRRREVSGQTIPVIHAGKLTLQAQSARSNIDHMKIAGGRGIAMKMHLGMTILSKGASEVMLYSQAGYPILVGRRIR